MLIGLALIAAAILGTAIHFVVPDRPRRGAAVATLVATAAAGVIYAGLTWLGVTQGDPLLWLASIGGATLISLVVTILTTSLRARADAAEQRRLGIA